MVRINTPYVRRDTSTDEGHTIWFSGKFPKYRHGVAFIVRKEVVSPKLHQLHPRLQEAHFQPYLTEAAHHLRTNMRRRD
ncbi:hypothetical protein DPMN_144676 [Dreissena polymorpha]|uniref:Uncharacterized protein n=1 Tax=Dreissena polymorpha TaxID=45954 RepID=A0A9D4IWT2_DREPO|nr:hypothetical protein DPMN_144676 [Dreissena polymorpha]